MEVTREFTDMQLNIQKIDEPEFVANVNYVALCDIDGFKTKSVNGPYVMEDLHSTEIRSWFFGYKDGAAYRSSRGKLENCCAGSSPQYSRTRHAIP
jgi:hypothetical protein